MEQLLEIVDYRCKPSDEGKMVRQLLRGGMGLSRRLIRQIVTSQGILLNGEHAYLGTRVKEGDRLQLFVLREESVHILPEPLPLDIVYEDADLLVVNKPAGMVVHPTRGHYTGTLANGAVYHWLAQGEKARFHPVHRIDQDTSGLVLIAKSRFAHQQVAKELETHTLQREYQAVVHGRLGQEEGCIAEPIGRDPERPYLRRVLPEGRPAVTHYRVLERFSRGTWIQLRLETGRTHQIRVHLAFLGHPLFGDALYGHGDEEWIERQALHAGTLGVTHPRSKERLVWHAPLPQDMEDLIQKLRGESG